MLNPLGKKIEIDLQRYSTVLGLLSSISSGESSPLFLEEKVRELQGTVPFLTTAVSWMAVAMDRVSEAKQQDVQNDPEALKNFLVHTDMLCRAQGALAALLCVAENIRAQSTKEAKKPAKGKRNARKKPKDQTRNV